jgi:hypothetical protein
MGCFIKKDNMKKNCICFSSLFISLVFFINCSGQTSDTTKQKVQFKLSLNYNSSLNYYGRTDSLRSSGVFPMAELWFTPNFYINAAPVFVNNKVSKFDYAGTVTSIGYQHVSDKWINSVYFLKPFYKENTQLVQAALKAQAGANFTHLSKAIDFTLGGDIKFSDKIDFGLTGGIDHLFKKQFSDNSVLVIDPSIYVYAGKQQFTNTYYKHSNFLFFPGTQQQVSENVKKFNILSYEFSIPVVFAKGKFMLLFTPAYVIPQNLITVANRPDLSERGKEMFYATLGAKIIF